MYGGPPGRRCFGTSEVLGQFFAQLIQRMGQVRPIALHRAFGAPAEAGPYLSRRVLGLHKQHVALPFRSMRKQQNHRIRFVKTGEIKEIAVLPEGPFAVGVMAVSYTHLTLPTIYSV